MRRNLLCHTESAGKAGRDEARDRGLHNDGGLPVPSVTESITIDRPQAVVYRYLTNPACWPEWQPAVLAVHGALNRPLRLGDAVTTDFRVAGRTGVVVWTVIARHAPALLTLQGLIAGQHNGGSVTYRLTPRCEGVLLEREFSYDTQRPIMRVQDALDLQRQVREETEAALQRLKQRLEGM